MVDAGPICISICNGWQEFGWVKMCGWKRGNRPDDQLVPIPVETDGADDAHGQAAAETDQFRTTRLPKRSGVDSTSVVAQAEDGVAESSLVVLLHRQDRKVVVDLLSGTEPEPVIRIYLH